ncbi:MAG: peptide chain release factor N(5)-glutamine methyltransferase [Candidatus Pacebacteria bacterium]|nr:peptide chain release factor N(5)-glutamine methyltransferase [Candidatus Paceibacterota bacterium]
MTKVKFFNCKIDISKKVFEPRVETEFWVRKAIHEIENCKSKIANLKALDIFSGSGCIGISILKNIKGSKVNFADISKDSVDQIKINLRLNRIGKERYKIYQTNLFQRLKNKKYDFIFANPPYVAENRISEVQEEVLKKDPKIALFGGEDGMDYIKKFFGQVKINLNQKGKVFLEFDPLQKEKIKEILEKEKFKFNFKKDQFGKYRWLEAKI